MVKRFCGNIFLSKVSYFFVIAMPFVFIFSEVVLTFIAKQNWMWKAVGAS